MKLFCIAKPVVVVSITLILSLVFASSSEARNSLGHRLSTGIVTLGMLALPFTPALTANVLAQNSEKATPAQVVQAQPQVDSLIPLYEVVVFNHYSEFNLEEIKALLEAGKIDVNARDEEGNTGLHVMVKDGNVEVSVDMLQLLLDHGLDAKILDNEGRTAQSYLSYMYGGEPETWREEALWTKTIYGINGENNDGTALKHALSWASYPYDIELARSLVAEGADVRLVDYEDGYVDLGIFDAVDAAAALVMEGDAFIKVAEEKADKGGIVSVVKERGEDLLKVAARWGNVVVAEVLLNHGVNPSVGMFDAAYMHGDSGNLIVSDSEPDNSVLTLLLKHGADVNFKHDNGETAINVANTPRTVEILLTHGAYPNVHNQWEMTPLHQAAKRSSRYAFEMVSMLLARGANANVKDIDGKTPYDNAISRGHVFREANAALLLYATVGAEGEDAQGRTPEYWAKKSGNETIQKIVAGEMGITQLFDRETRRRVSKELLETTEKE